MDFFNTLSQSQAGSLQSLVRNYLPPFLLAVSFVYAAPVAQGSEPTLIHENRTLGQVFARDAATSKTPIYPASNDVLLSSEFERLAPGLNRTAQPDRYDALLVNAALARKLDIESQQRGYFEKVPAYRTRYAAEIFLDQNSAPSLSSALESSSAEQRYQEIRSRLGATAPQPQLPLLPILNVDWKSKPRSESGREALRAIFKATSKNAGEWSPTPLQITALPESFVEFENQLSQQLTAPYRLRTRQKVLNELLVENSPSCIAKLQNISPGAMRDFYESHAAEFKIQPTRITWMDIEFSEGRSSQSFLNESRVIQETAMSRLNSTGENTSHTLAALNSLRRELQAQITHLAEQHGAVVREKSISWPQKTSGLPEGVTSLEAQFALMAPLDSVLIPNLNFSDELKKEHVLLLLTEERAAVETLPFSDARTLNRIETQLKTEIYEGCSKKLTNRLLDNSILFSYDLGLTRERAKSLAGTPSDFLNLGLSQTQVPAASFPTLSKTDENPLENRPNEVIHRFPEMHNPNAAGGRLYLQPLGSNDDQVVEGVRVDVSVASYGEFNRHFHDGSISGPVEHRPTSQGVNPDLLYMNGNVLQVMLTQGFRVRGYKIEAGAIVRAYMDREENEMEIFLAAFHKWEGNSPNHFPPAGQPYGGTIGNNKTVIVGRDGQIYLAGADLFAKIQLLEEKRGTFTPNLSLKASFRIPLSGLPFDTFGAGLTLGYSKHLTNWFKLIASASVGFQNLTQEDFNASNLDVRRLTYDFFAGFVVDPGKAGGFYFSAGLRYSSIHISYPSNPASENPSKVIQLSFNYQAESGAWEFYIYAAEEIPQLDGSLQPDFLMGVGYSYHFGAKRKNELPELHE